MSERLNILNVRRLLDIDRGDAFHGWPTVTQARDGRLLLVYSGGREAHICPYGRVELRISEDNGETWSPPHLLVDGPIDDRDAGILETSQGTLLTSWFTSIAWAHELEQNNPDIASPQSWHAIRSRLSDQLIDEELGTWLIRSEDGGQIWSNRVNPLASCPHGPILLSEGRLLFVGRRRIDPGQRSSNGSPFGTMLGASHSTDDGRTWQWLSDIPTRLGDESRHYHEPHAVEADDGSIVALIRNHNPTNQHEMLQCVSRDGGVTWSTPYATGIVGYPPHLLKLRDGRLLLSYGHRLNPLGNRVRLSDDHGQSWSDALTINDDSPHPDLGYPSTVELHPGQFITVWYERRARHAVLRQACWELLER